MRKRPPRNGAAAFSLLQMVHLLQLDAPVSASGNIGGMGDDDHAFPGVCHAAEDIHTRLGIFLQLRQCEICPIAFFISERLKPPDPDACFMALLRFCVICAVTLIPDKAASLESVDACRIYRLIEIENAMMVMRMPIKTLFPWKVLVRNVCNA